MLNQAEIYARLAALESRLQQLTDRVARLEGTTQAPLTFPPTKFPPTPPTVERRLSPYPICTRCNVALGSVSGYCCPYQDCPTGLGGAFSQTRTD